MNALSRLFRLSAGFLLLTAGAARAQAPTPQSAPGTEQPVYTYVEQMPQLPSGGGNRAIQAAIKERLVIARKDAKACRDGQVQVRFTVDATGAVKDPKIERGLDAACNEAVLEAVRKLPTFSPGVQNGKKVAVYFIVPVAF